MPEETKTEKTSIEPAEETGQRVLSFPPIDDDLYEVELPVSRVTLLEAHTRARIASTAADVPVTTSERWLRVSAPASGPTAPVELPEEVATIEALGARLGLVGREADAQRHLAQSEQVIAAASARLELSRAEEDAAYRALAAGLLARWPVLDDPWHPDFRTTVERDAAAIAEHLDGSADHARYHTARAATALVDAEVAELGREAAPYERLARAIETRTLAARLAARGGPDWATYTAILDCERTAP